MSFRDLTPFVRNDPICQKERRSNAEIIQGTRNALATLLEDVGVDHGGGNIIVPEQLLNGADVGAALQQVSGEGMPIMPSSALSS